MCKVFLLFDAAHTHRDHGAFLPLNDQAWNEATRRGELDIGSIHELELVVTHEDRQNSLEA